MKVALDATPLTLTSGGLRRYVSELTRALRECFPEDEFLLASDQPFRTDIPAQQLVPSKKLGSKWWSFGLSRSLRAHRINVFHGTNFEVPYLPLGPSVLSLHDLSPWMDAAWHDSADRVRSRTPVLIGFRAMTLVLTDTIAVKNQAIERFGIHPSRVCSVPLGGLPAAAIAQALNGARPTPHPYFLFVGALEPRKNLPFLIEVWREVRRYHLVDLVIAGKRRADFPALAEELGLHILGEIEDGNLPALYAQALACLYPSLYEGFGLPVLEAMQCGAAVITSRDPAITEVAGGGAVQLDTRDRRAWFQALCQAASDSDFVASWRERATVRGREFSWARTALMTREVYDEAARRFGE